MLSLHSTPVRVETGSVPRSASARRRSRLATLLGLVAGLCALAFPLAPVEQQTARYHWPEPGSADTATAMPLLPYQPLTLEATFSCAAVAAASASGPGPHVVLSTTPPRVDPAAAPLPGLRVVEDDGMLRISSYGTRIAQQAVPAAGECTWQVHSDHRRTELRKDGNIVARVDADVRPAVSGAFTDSSTVDGLRLDLVADTRFQTAPSSAKLALGIACLLALGAMLAAVGRLDRAHRGHSRTGSRRGWWRPRAVDGVVAALAVVWQFIGPVTVDDGYIAGIVRGSEHSGFLGNAYRWLNAPEAPFSWIYEPYRLWSQVSVEALWLRVPSTLLLLSSWWLLSRLLLPRLGRFGGQRWVPWLAATALLVWWLPFNLGLRPEPWVAVGTLAVFYLVERAIATWTIRPLALAVALAPVTAAVTPGGIMALAPLGCAAVPLFRLLRTRTDLSVTARVVVPLAALGVAALPMFADQGLAAVVEAVRVRTLIGGDLPWYQEPQRYAHLLGFDSFEGSLPRRAAVLLTLTGVAALMWTLSRRRARQLPGLSRPVAIRLTATFTVALATMTFTPTKWTQHFGALAGIGAAVLVVACHTWSRSRNWHTAELLAGLAVTTVVGSLVLAGRNEWPYLSNDGVTWGTITPQLGGVELATLALTMGGTLTVALAIVAAWRRSGGRRALPGSSRLPSPALLTALLMVATVGLSFYSFGKAGLARADSYTMASDNLAAAQGDSCGLADALAVEADPRRGALPAAGAGPTATDRPELAVGGAVLPGWLAAPAEPTGDGTGPAFRTGWFRLSQAQRDGDLPVVVTTNGRAGRITARFAGPGTSTETEVAAPVSTERGDTVDVRVMAPGGAARVRLDVAAGGEPLAVSVPRSPELSPMNSLLPPGSSAVVDWPVAFFFPCVRHAAMTEGGTELPGWRLTTQQGNDAGEVAYSPVHGGPFAAARLLSRQQRVPVYLRGEPAREPARLYRWQPRTAARARPHLTERTVPGWSDAAPLNVPGLSG